MPEPAPPDATIGTQDIAPVESDCKTDDPVAGEVEGKVYVVLDVPAKRKAA